MRLHVKTALTDRGWECSVKIRGNTFFSVGKTREEAERDIVESTNRWRRRNDVMCFHEPVESV